MSKEGKLHGRDEDLEAEVRTWNVECFLVLMANGLNWELAEAGASKFKVQSSKFRARNEFYTAHGSVLTV